MVSPGPADVRVAADRIGGATRRTPLHLSAWLSRPAGVPVYLKLECWQRTGSFKIRGAANAVAALEPAEGRAGLVTASAGNHGLAVACAAADRGLDATVFVPAAAPDIKKRRIRRRGARLREVDGGYDDAAAAARSHAEAAGARFLHPFDDPLVVAGQGTVALEILDDAPEVRTVVVPVGGGGLLAGVGIALSDRGARGGRTADESPEVVGVQSTATRAMHAAFGAGRVVPVPDEPTLCDGLAGETEPGAFQRARTVTDGILLVDEARVAPAVAALYREEGIVAEGSAAVVVAALLTGVFEPTAPTALVISGGNIDGSRLGRILVEQG